MVLTFTGVLTDVRLRRCEHAAEAVQRLKQRLPPGQRLASLDGHTDSLFAYHYGRPLITPLHGPPPENAPAPPEPFYFCLTCPGDTRPQLPFAWEELGVVPLDRNHRPVPERVVVVGRLRPAGAVLAPGGPRGQPSPAVPAGATQ
jgi:hypothetical protein